MRSLRTTVLAGLGFCLAALTPAAPAAAASSALISVTTTERAGPSAYYPVVDVIPGGATVTMYGCLPGGSWCDVSYAGDRGWVPGSYLEAYYQSQPVFIPDYIGEIGVPIVTFDIDVYWNDYYHDRPFYAERGRFGRYAHGPGARIAATTIVPGPHGRGRGVVAGPVHPHALAAVGPKDLRVIHTTNGRHQMAIAHAHPAHPMIAARPMVKGPRIAGGRSAAKFAMAPHGGPKFCRGKGACG